jgi:hypothetical protein
MSEQDLGFLFNEMRQREQAGLTDQLKFTLLQGQCAARVKRSCPKSWKSDLQEHVGCKKSTWHQRLAIFRDFGCFLLPEIPDDHVTTLPSSLVLLTQLTKGCDDAARQAHLEAIAGLSYSDVKKYVAERKGTIKCECARHKEIQIPAWECIDCGKVRTKAPESDIASIGDPRCEDEGREQLSILRGEA